MSDIQRMSIPGFKFDNGDTLDIFLAYKSLNSTATKKALITNCFTGSFAMINTFTGPGSALADYHAVVVMQMGMGESSSPSNTPNFPEAVSYQDQIRAQHVLLTQLLGFDHLDVALGYSMGGQAVYHWAVMYPDFVKNGVVICAAAVTSGHTYALTEGFLGAMTHASDWEEYLASGTKPVKGLTALSRAYMPWLYSSAWYKDQVYTNFGMPSLKEFLTFCDSGFHVHDPKDLIVQVRQWQNADIGKLGAGIEKTLGSIKTRMLLLPSKTDYQFTPEDVAADLAYLKNAKMEIIPSTWGHCAGHVYNPVDIAWIDQAVKDFLGT